MLRTLVAGCMCALFLLSMEAQPASADGPWKAQVVDAETKQPLEGVVVVAAWTKYVWGPLDFGGPSYEYYDSEEVLTDKDGRFIIPARSVFSFNPFAFFRGPYILIFKPGYGRDFWPGYDKLSELERKSLSQAAQLFQRDGVVIEMPRLRSLEKRREYLGKFDMGFTTVPREKTPLLEKAITEERRALGYRS
jgi:hypothetical protein